MKIQMIYLPHAFFLEVKISLNQMVEDIKGHYKEPYQNS